MKCYYHIDRDAVATCGACSRGLCMECGVDLTRGLACKGPCEQELRRLLDLRDFSFSQPHRSDQILRSSAGVQVRSAIFLLATGAIMCGYAYYDRRYNFLLWIGAIEIVFGLTNLWNAVRRRRVRGDQFRLCPKCGYNVTGNTSGRCPECNYLV